MEINEKKIDIQDYLRVILKHQWVILTVFSVIFISVVIFTFTATPIYQATVRLIIEKENPKVVSVQEVMSVDSSGLDYYQTQYKIIESRTVAREVIKRLQLDQNEEFVPKPKDTILSNIRSSISDFKAYILSLFVTERAKNGSNATDDLLELQSPLVSQFISRIKVSPIRNSRLVDVSFEAKDPVMSARLANELARAYIDTNLATKLKATSEAVVWLNNQIEDQRKKVDTAEQSLLRYKEQQGIVTDFSSDVETITAQKLAELNRQVVEAEAKRVEAETRYKQAAVLEKTPEMLDSIPEVLSNDLIREIKKQEVELFKKNSELSKKYGPNHPQIIALNKEMETMQSSKIREIRRVISSLYNEYRVALAREHSLKSSLGRQKGESLSMNQKAIDYNVLKREADSTKEMYDLLIKRFKETSLTEDIKTGNIRVIDPAEIPKSPFKPKKTQNILLAIVVGLSMGVGMAFFLEYLDNTIKLPEDIKRYLDIPYLGPVPAFTEVEDGNPEKSPRDDLVVMTFPKSTASESYRGIRTSILFSAADHTPQVILISSAGPAEGKTITAANLAVTMSQAGSKVLLVDCDMRRPRLHNIFDVTRDKGMSNILVGSCNIDEALIHTKLPNIDVIPCGPIPPNPSEILGSHRMGEFLEQIRGRYERIIVDSPPITAVTDAVILSKFVDGVIMVIRAGETHREIVKNGLSQLRAVDAHVLGCILNSVDMARDSYYYYQYYYYYYGEEGEKRKKTHKSRRHGNHHHGSGYISESGKGDSPLGGGALMQKASMTLTKVVNEIRKRV